MSHYVHHVPGRLRVRIPSIKGNTIRANEVEKFCRKLNGLDTVEANTVTGSLIIKYHSDILSHEEIMEKLRKNNYLNGSPQLSNPQPFDRAATKAGMALSKALFGWALSKAFKGTGLSFLTVFI